MGQNPTEIALSAGECKVASAHIPAEDASHFACRFGSLANGHALN